MIVGDLLKMDWDVDVYDDYDERLCVAFCGPAKLTSFGTNEWVDVLNMNITIGDNVVVVNCETGREASRAKKFFDSLAGYCSESDWNSWFID